MQQLRTPRAQLHDMWSKEPKQARIREPRVLHLRKQNQHHHHQRAEVNLETTKAVAWAVFQHHGGGDGGAHSRGHNSHGLQQQHNRRPSRFKIEAQMKHELAHHTYTPPLVGAPRWDAGSTLFDSFELESLLRTLDQATHPLHDDDDDLYDDDARAVVLYSPNAQPQSRLGDEYEDEEEDDDDDEEFFFDTPAKSKRVAVVPVKEELKAHHHNMWKSFLHSLHLDGFHKLQSQVAPHDVAAQSKKKHSKRARGRSGGMDAQQQQQEHRHQLWKLSVKAAIKGQEQDLQSALAVASEAVSQQKQHHHHHHHYQHHHHHVHDEREDDEMTIQAITKRAARTSLDETRRRVSIEFERGNGLEAPRNSLDIDDRERAGVPKSLSLWDVFEL